MLLEVAAADAGRTCQAGEFRPVGLSPSLSKILYKLTLHVVNSMFITRWGPLRRSPYANALRATRRWRYQSTTTAPISPISSVLLGRARALAAEHAQLSKQLDSEYDIQLAKKAGALSNVAEALNGWEAANNVSHDLSKPTPSD